MKEAGVGIEIPPSQAQAGDFVHFWRSQSGHSAIFLNWIYREGKVIGLHYRSSQRSTDGIGNQTEYIQGVAGKIGTIDPARIYFGRLGKSN